MVVMTVNRLFDPDFLNVSFPNLRTHLLSPRVLHGLGSLLGRLLRTDKAITSRFRPSVARILIKLYITKQFPDHVWLGSEKFGYVQQVEMEEFPFYCSHCKALGHSNAGYLILHPHLDVKSAPPTVNLQANVPSVCEASLPGGLIALSPNPEVILHMNDFSACEEILLARPVALENVVGVPMNCIIASNLVCLGETNAVMDSVLLPNSSHRSVDTPLAVQNVMEENIVACELNRVVEQECSSGSAHIGEVVGVVSPSFMSP
ncbi:uncharacterized protein LOC110104533 [Dendrobium catenatum]|uniref:uncharacterized protein LOC110104533 n=1 Tax=Dendrobium catenatum TaxID=906689 RepID=UPI0009F61E05|nr:uncharacterized protein LOC110104533 [Dendrobium catenatum]